jgi:hypothetical protein
MESVKGAAEVHNFLLSYHLSYLAGSCESVLAIIEIAYMIYSFLRPHRPEV